MIPDKNAYKKFLTGQRQWVVWYILVTFLLVFTTDPVHDLDNCGQLTLFVLFATLCFFLGSKSFTWLNPPENLESMHWRVLSLDNNYKGCIAIASAQLILYSLATMLTFADFNTAMSNILSPGKAYQLRLELMTENLGSSNIIGQLCVITGILYYLFFVPGMVYFNRMPRWLKLLYISGLISYVLYYVSIGTMKGLGDVICFLIIANIARQGIYRCFPKDPGRNDFHTIQKKYIYLAAGLVLAYFVVMQESRVDVYDYDVLSTQSRSFWIQHMPYPLATAGLSFTGYLSNGYVGLGHALSQDFVFSYGFGIAPSAVTYLINYAGWEDCYQYTYLARSENTTGWPGLMLWSTLFAWLASDLTFFGAALFMVLIGYLWAWSWTKMLFTRSIVAFLVLSELSILIVYIPANNQVMWASRGIWAVLTTLLLAVIERVYGREYDCSGPVIPDSIKPQTR